MKKIRNYGFWVALSGAVVMLVNSLGQMFGFAIADEVVSGVIMAVAGVLVVLGVVNMPPKEEQNEEETNKEDDKQEDDKEDL